MGFFNSAKEKIKKVNEEFNARKEERQQKVFQRREEKLARLNNERLKAETVRQQRADIRSEKSKLLNARIGNITDTTSGFMRVAKNVKGKLDQRSRGRMKVNLGGSPGNFGSNIFTASSNSPNNIYFKGSSSNNPYQFSSSKPKQRKKSRQKSVIIRL